MIDVGTIAAGLASLKSASEIVKGLMDAREFANSQTKLIELRGQILAGLDSALVTKMDQAALLDEIHNLKKQIAEFETWGAEKQRYHRTKVGAGVIAFILKPEEQGVEPFHMLCAKCYHDAKPSELQPMQKLERGHRVHFCPRCKTEYVIGEPQPPSQLGKAATKYDPFSEL